MQTFLIVKEVEFDYGHRVPNHASKCRNVHGHRGRVLVEVEGPLLPEGSGAAEGMVMDFGDIKQILEEEIVARFDHRMLISMSDCELHNVLRAFIRSDSLGSNVIGAVYRVDGFGWVQELPGVPTAENLARLCFRLLTARINTQWLTVRRVLFYETPKSYAVFPASDQSQPIQMVLGINA